MILSCSASCKRPTNGKPQIAKPSQPCNPADAFGAADFETLGLMDKYDSALAVLIEHAIHECDLATEALAEVSGAQAALATARSAMLGYLNAAKGGRLPRPAKTRGLYFGLGLSECFAGVQIPYESIRQLMLAAHQVDQFYSEECKCPRSEL